MDAESGEPLTLVVTAVTAEFRGHGRGPAGHAHGTVRWAATWSQIRQAASSSSTLTTRFVQIRGDADLVTDGALEHLDALTRSDTCHPAYYGHM
jgi:hypothetical protein